MLAEYLVGDPTAIVWTMAVRTGSGCLPAAASSLQELARRTRALVRMYRWAILDVMFTPARALSRIAPLRSRRPTAPARIRDLRWRPQPVDRGRRETAPRISHIDC